MNTTHVPEAGTCVKCGEILRSLRTLPLAYGLPMTLEDLYRVRGEILCSLCITLEMCEDRARLCLP